MRLNFHASSADFPGGMVQMPVHLQGWAQEVEVTADSKPTVEGGSELQDATTA